MFAKLTDFVLFVQPAYAVQTVMCAERTPLLACVLPAFDSVLAAWKDMRNDPSKSHLRSALDAGIEKMTLQYNSCRYRRPFIFAIGNFFLSFSM